MKLRKTGEGTWEGDRVALRLKRNRKGLWEANESVLDRLMDPLQDIPEFNASFLNSIRPCVRKSRRQRKNIPDDVPSPPPSSSDDDIFEPVKRMTKKTLKRRK